MCVSPAGWEGGGGLERGITHSGAKVDLQL